MIDDTASRNAEETDDELIIRTDHLKDASWKLAAEIAPYFGIDGLPVYGKCSLRAVKR